MALSRRRFARVGGRSCRLLPGLVAIVVLAWMLPTALGSGPVATAQEAGVREEAETTWVIEPDEHRATVTIALTVTNTTPDADGRRTWWDGWGVALPTNPTTLTVTTADGGTPVGHDATTTDQGAPAIRWDFPERLLYDDSQRYVVEAVFDSAPPRSDWTAGPRINPGFVAVPAWAWGRDEATLVVRAPARLDARLGAERAHERDGDTDVWRATVDVAQVDVLLGAAPRSDHVAEVVTVGDTEVTVLAWPDDPEWGQQVADFAARALPALADWTGTPWDGNELVIRETATPFVEGWGGWNDASSDTISVGEPFDQALWTHELAHNWFDADEFTDTWLAEGLSETVTAALADQLDVDDPPVPEPTDRVLADWDAIVATTDRARLEEPDTWHETTSDLYAGAHHVVSTVAEELGADAFRELVRMSLVEESIWTGPGEITVLEAADWREFLALAEHHGSTRARDLLLEHVVPDAGPVLDRRDEVLAEHARLADHPWATPVGIRQSLQYWQLDEASAAIRDAFALRDRIDRQAARAAELESGWPDLRPVWETGTPAALVRKVDVLTELLDEIEAVVERAGTVGVPTPVLAIDLTDDEAGVVRARLADMQATIDRVAEARDGVAEAREDDVVRIGLVGSDPERLVEDATAALAAGDVTAARSATSDLATMLDGADDRGRRFLAIGAVVAIVALAGLAVAARRRRRRS